MVSDHENNFVIVSELNTLCVLFLFEVFVHKLFTSSLSLRLPSRTKEIVTEMEMYFRPNWNGSDI